MNPSNPKTAGPRRSLFYSYIFRAESTLINFEEKGPKEILALNYVSAMVRLLRGLGRLCSASVGCIYSPSALPLQQLDCAALRVTSSWKLIS